jgi:hypothetical protein
VTGLHESVKTMEDGPAKDAVYEVINKAKDKITSKKHNHRSGGKRKEAGGTYDKSKSKYTKKRRRDNEHTVGFEAGVGGGIDQSDIDTSRFDTLINWN